MALFGFNSRWYEMLMSVCFTCLCNLTHRKLRCAGKFYMYVPIMIYVPACRGKACVRFCTHLQAFIHETDANSELRRYTAELQDGAPLHAQNAIQFWLARESSYKRSTGSAGTGSCGISCLSSLFWILFSRCVVIWQQENGTELGCPCIGGYFWNWTVTFCI